jgi:hypothetical protein
MSLPLSNIEIRIAGSRSGKSDRAGSILFPRGEEIRGCAVSNERCAILKGPNS